MAIKSVLTAGELLMAWLDETDVYGDKAVEEGQYKCPACGGSMKEDVELCDTCEFKYDKVGNKD